MKYIVIKNDSGEYLFTFRDDINHSDFADTMKTGFAGDVVSAGFVKRDTYDNLRCTGKSTSLGVTSRPEDSALLEQMLDY